MEGGVWERRMDIRGSFHYWESELTFGNLTNFWKLANQKVRLFHKSELTFGANFWGLTLWGVPLPTNLFKSELTIQKLAPQWISQSEALLQWKG